MYTKREHGKERYPVLSVRNAMTLERRQKRRYQKERVQRYQSSQINQRALISRRSDSKRNSHPIVGTQQNILTTRPKVDANGDKSVFKHTSKAMQLLPYNRMRQEFNCVLNGGRTTTFPVQSILMKIGGPSHRRNSKFDTVAMGKILLYSREREKDHRKELSSEDPEMIAIRMLLLARICTTCGLNIVKGIAQHCLPNPWDVPRKLCF